MSWSITACPTSKAPTMNMTAAGDLTAATSLALAAPRLTPVHVERSESDGGDARCTVHPCCPFAAVIAAASSREPSVGCRLCMDHRRVCANGLSLDDMLDDRNGPLRVLVTTGTGTRVQTRAA